MLLPLICPKSTINLNPTKYMVDKNNRYLLNASKDFCGIILE